ncbi:Receptor-like protein 7 [Linum perenne]
MAASQISTMKPYSLTWCFISLLLIPLCMGSTHVPFECRKDQQSLLLQLKHGLSFNHSLSQKLVRWNASTECCDWPGIRCDPGGLGHVIGLDLSNEFIIEGGGGGLHNSLALFSLRYLEDLDLSYNYFNTTIPAAVGDLTKLRYLELSSAGFFGEIPAAISQLTSLITLDLSFNDLKLENQNLALLVQNLTQLTDFRLNRVNLSTQGKEWCHVLSSSLPNLEMLSMSDCFLSGPLDPSLSNLQSLSSLDLSYNNLSSQVPDSLAELKNLTSLRMSDSRLTGTFPMKIIQSLTKLEDLDLSFNQFLGNIPDHWENIQKLVRLNLRGNSFNGTIPPSLFSIPSLDVITLSDNQLQGQVSEFSVTNLRFIDLHNNSLEGPIPRSIFELPSLCCLFLSSNRFSGRVQLSWFQGDSLNLSHNNLTVDVSGNNSSTLSDFPQFKELRLASCNLRAFPDLRNQSDLSYLDLSNNSINGIIPRSVLESTRIYYLDLSQNNLVSLEVQYLDLPSIGFLDMHDNLLQGNIPINLSPSSPVYVDFSSNLFSGGHLFSGYMSANLSKSLSLTFFSIANNDIRGEIPASICSMTDLEVLDLSNNSLNGSIPRCLMENISKLVVLDIGGNKLSGDIPDTFQASCSLQTLDLNDNRLQGRVPKSLNNCKTLEVLDLGNNLISDVFPCFLKTSSSLRVLVLRNNLFRGSIWCPRDLSATWQKLQIVDLAFNNFSGPLNADYIATWEGMMGDGKGMNDHLQFNRYATSLIDLYYQDSITVVNKGLQMEYKKILTVFKSIDFSSNNLDGPIPDVIGKFRALQVINFSHNALSGNIPSVFGNLSNLESLDLSHNNLSGHIPTELASLTFLSFMNLSDNHLVGSIPTGSQLQLLENTSFGGNPDLCGRPLSKPCAVPPAPPGINVRREKSSTRINWDFLSKVFGYVFGLGVVMLPAALWPSFRLWYWPKIDSLILWMFPKLYVKDWNNRLRKNRSQRRSKQRVTGQ